MIKGKEEESQPRILVVEDDAIMRGVACESLTDAGFSVSEAENGVQALEAVERFAPDIILMDVMMPEMNGFDTSIALRRMAGCGTVPILIMTALDDLDSINRAYEVGATDFITKPINWVILVQRVRYMMRAVRMMNAQKRLEDELQQAQKLEAVATIAGGVAHDFNNLLQTIQGSSELLLLKRSEDAPGLHEINQIIAAVKRGGELTRQLLTYSRKIKSEKRAINLNEHTHQVHELLQRTIPKMIQIELCLAQDLKMVNADSVQMEQVVMNLALNARDAMPDGGRMVIETANVRLPENVDRNIAVCSPQDYVLISISDTGQGMDEDTLEQIFEPFFSTKAPGKGTGLGLSMVHGIIQNHNGQIACHSTPGEGTCFRIYLPAVEPVRAKTPNQGKDLTRGGKETLLIVDDDETICYFGKQQLETAGYTVLTASAGEMALEIYGQNGENIHLVILDLIMPGMGGARCLQALLKIDPGVNVVIISGYAPDDPTMQAIDAHASGFLRKPYTGEMLLGSVRKALDTHRPFPSSSRTYLKHKERNAGTR